MKMLGKCMSLSHITFYVSNAKQMAINYCLQYGFRPFRYRGPENGCRLQTSHAVINNDIILVFVSPLIVCEETKPINDHIVKHGDAVKDIAFKVDSIEQLVKNIRQKNVTDITVKEESDKNGSIKSVTLLPFGDTTHTVIEQNGYPKNLFLPGWTTSPLEPITKSIWAALPSIKLDFIDHFAINQPIGKLSQIAEWYENVLGFDKFDSSDHMIIKTSLSGLKTTFLTNNKNNIKIKSVISEPLPGLKRSQIQEFLDHNYGSGVQHIAFHTNDICRTVTRLRDRGVVFLSTPDTYYDRLIERLKKMKLNINHDISTLRKLNILMDFDEKGYLLQIFTPPVQDRPTFFLELIERHEFNGFGAGNIKALFESIEIQQKLRELSNKSE